jgi:hypothetical protein
LKKLEKNLGSFFVVWNRFVKMSLFLNVV